MVYCTTTGLYTALGNLVIVNMTNGAGLGRVKTLMFRKLRRLTYGAVVVTLAICFIYSSLGFEDDTWRNNPSPPRHGSSYSKQSIKVSVRLILTRMHMII